jgi:hypothetical protein
LSWAVRGAVVLWAVVRDAAVGGAFAAGRAVAAPVRPLGLSTSALPEDGHLGDGRLAAAPAAG